MAKKPSKANLDKRVATAVRHFWHTRNRQGQHQGGESGRRDAGNRTQATGGKQLDGFTELVSELVVEAGIPEASVFSRGTKDVTLPGYFRATKRWDVVVVAEDQLLASVELKSLCGPSYGNNYNNRIEEALGSAKDIWTAYREGAFDHSPQPFVGYLMLLEEEKSSTSEVAVLEKHFRVQEEFRGASYATRCEWSLRRLVRERCYDATCLVLSDRKKGMNGKYREPAQDLCFKRFAKALCSHVKASYEAIRE
jgi:hypothetical protein